MSWTTEEAERVRTIEVTQADLKATVESMDSKLDQLMALKNKGAGVLWVASILASAAFTAIVSWFSGWFNGS